MAGDSAGGNLAAVVAQMARDRGGPAIAHQLLVYPCCDMDSNAWPSQTENGFDYFLTKESMDWFYDQYADVADRDIPYASPIKADSLSGLPPGVCDHRRVRPAARRGRGYGAALQEAGVACEVHPLRRHVPRAFFGMTLAIPGAVAAQETAAAAGEGHAVALSSA